MPSMTVSERSPAVSNSVTASDPERAPRLAALDSVPDFDVLLDSPQPLVAASESSKTETPAGSTAVAASSVTPEPPVTAPIANTPAAGTAAGSTTPVVAQSPATTPAGATATAAATPSKPQTSIAAATPTPPAAKGAGSATSGKLGVLVSPPQPFAWQSAGRTAGNRQFQTVRIGSDGYRTLVVGSIAGDDPLAIDLVDQLARKLHQDHLILGGFDCSVIRTLNPDGAFNHKVLNQQGQYINKGFPRSSAAPARSPLPEVTFLLERMQQLQPQRILHVRSINQPRGIIASGSSGRIAADEAAQWLGFSRVDLSAGAAEGSVERYIAMTGSSEIITFAFPDKTRREELWDRYGDTLLNLLLADDLATREIARSQAQKASADRRNSDPGK